MSELTLTQGKNLVVGNYSNHSFFKRLEDYFMDSMECIVYGLITNFGGYYSR